MANYVKGIPIDKNNTPLQEYAGNVSVLAVRSSENATASSVISLTHDTTALEIAAVGGAAFMRFVRTSETEASVVAVAGATANFAHVIPSGTVRRFVVPIESQSLYGSVVGVNRQFGLYQRVAYKSGGIASVFMTEY